MLRRALDWSSCSASAAASCSARFLLVPNPRPSDSASTTASISNSRLCGGPLNPSTLYATDWPLRARNSCSSVLWSM